MPLTTNYINNKINEFRLADNAKKIANHKPSGRLSAGALFRPVRSQLLKTLGLPQKPFNAYTLGVFDKGNQVEAKFISSLRRISCLIEGKNVEKYNLTWDKEANQAVGYYRETIGLVDAVVNTNKFDDIGHLNLGVIPFEVKSVTSYKFKHIKKMRGDIDWHYKLQACQNALAMKSEHYAVVIISKEHDDPAISIFETKELKNDVDKIISNYIKATEDWAANRNLPVWNVGRVPWIEKYSWFDKKYWYDDELVRKTLKENHGI